MKCCGSPAVSAGIEPPSQTAAAIGPLQAILFSEILKPLEKTLGPVGDVVVGTVAQSLFVKPGR